MATTEYFSITAPLTVFYSLLRNCSSWNPDGSKQGERELHIKKHQKSVLKSSRQESSNCSHTSMFIHVSCTYNMRLLQYYICGLCYVGLVCGYSDGALVYPLVCVCVCIYQSTRLVWVNVISVSKAVEPAVRMFWLPSGGEIHPAKFTSLYWHVNT